MVRNRLEKEFNLQYIIYNDCHICTKKKKAHAGECVCVLLWPVVIFQIQAIYRNTILWLLYKQQI